MLENGYKSLEQFIGEYSGVRNEKYDIVYGLDFRYKGKLYRMTMDQMESDSVRQEFEIKLNKKLGKYEVALVDEDYKSEFQFEEYHFLGWYDDVYDLLENCIIEGAKFKDVILDKNTIIEGKD